DATTCSSLVFTTVKKPAYVRLIDVAVMSSDNQVDATVDINFAKCFLLRSLDEYRPKLMPDFCSIRKPQSETHSLDQTLPVSCDLQGPYLDQDHSFLGGYPGCSRARKGSQHRDSTLLFVLAQTVHAIQGAGSTWPTVRTMALDPDVQRKSIETLN
ncbi:hypothetical protein MJO28_009197, partial [Puccinia striiformis f. sp. tritici]